MSRFPSFPSLPCLAPVHPPWTALCRIHRHRILVTVGPPGCPAVLRARLPLPSAHPRALLELLEALASHSGHRLDAVICVDARSGTSFDEGGPGDDLRLGPSALVHVVHVTTGSRQLRLLPDVWGSR